MVKSFKLRIGPDESFLTSGARLAEADWQQRNQCQGGFRPGLSQGGASSCHSFMLLNFHFLHHYDIIMAKVRAALAEAIEAANCKAVSRATKVDMY